MAIYISSPSSLVREKPDTLLLGDGEILQYFPVLLGGGEEGRQGGQVKGMGRQAIRKKGGEEIKGRKKLFLPSL
jgi:hypothetical protein